MELRVEKRVYSRLCEFFLFDRLTHSVGVEVTMQKVEEGATLPSPTFTMNETNTQMLMDELWRCGFRPSEGTGSAGSLAATERHLEDMRALVFKGRKPWQDK